MKNVELSTMLEYQVSFFIRDKCNECYTAIAADNGRVKKTDGPA